MLETQLLFALVGGAVVGGGLLLFGLAVRGLPRKRPGPRRARSRQELLRKLTTRTGIAIIMGFGVLAVTRWPVAAIASALLVIGWHGLVGGAAEERKAIKQVEALAQWTESLRDTIAGAIGLEQAIPTTIRAASPILQPHLRALSDRLHTRMPLPDALRRFADELDDSSADLVIAALILNAKLRGPGLRDLLGALAVSARDELEMRRRVEANRRVTRRSVQIIVGVSVGIAVLLTLFNYEYVRPYRSFVGQLVLVVVVALYALGFAWLRRLATFEKPARLISGSTMPPDASWLREPARDAAALAKGGGR